ncbi:MAG: hypothetical protein H6721_02280 [Sandaracinus sp.]|nr:hypothetical protein [Sandaracinus sp.]MCB9624484.1 hypothetical protein [Sandaracinus sp.]MCB9630966.1 hypothetical protein [Sandaracinus sp.]
MSWLRSFGWCCVFVVVGCTQSRVPLGTDDGGVRRDGGGIPCGRATCTGEEVCCNASCGICAAPDLSCPAIACEFRCGETVCEPGVSACCMGCDGEETCAGPGGECPPIGCPPPSCRDGSTCAPQEICCAGCFGESFCAEARTGCPEIDCPADCRSDADCGPAGTCCSDCTGGAYCSSGPCPLCPDPNPCAPMDAFGVGDCDLALGTAWNGSACVGLSGCSCEGTDCSRLYMSRAACAEATSFCGGCTSDAECGLDQWCDPCAHGSCPGCEDCVQNCAPSRCATGEMALCFAARPECGPNGTAIVRDGCWQCVDAYTCDPIDCSTTGCPVGEHCEPCFSGLMCIPDGAVC